MKPIHKTQNEPIRKGMIEKEKIKEKMLTILIDCHKEEEKSSEV